MTHLIDGISIDRFIAHNGWLVLAPNRNTGAGGSALVLVGVFADEDDATNECESYATRTHDSAIVVKASGWIDAECDCDCCFETRMAER